MPVDLRETRLPGVGVKWSMTSASGSRVTVIQHNDGDREV
jgi:K+/H+ antiporter YhaU regulatory subunit KhtT